MEHRRFGVEAHMKKVRYILLTGMLAAVLWSCPGCGQEQTHQKWDCSVENADIADDGVYAVTMSDAELTSETGCLTFQNQNDFSIEVHLLKGEQEEVFEIEPGMCTTYTQAATGEVYSVGVCADVGVGEEIRLAVYDGEWSEPY